jgi:N-acetylneuraminate synthase/N,N'-diacetyllegionaminate synthase
VSAQTFSIGGRLVGRGHPVFVICEAGVTNYGERELAMRQIDAAVESGADAVKFQAWQTEELVSRRVAERLAVELGFDWFARLKSKELTRQDLLALRDYARHRGIMFFVTAHDAPSLDFVVREIAPPLLKVGSGEAHNPEFLRLVGETGLPVLISFGFHDAGEVRRAINILRDAGSPAVGAMHCVTEYPTPPPLAHLERISALASLLDVPVGYSDHTVGWHVPLAAVARGATMLEKHLTFDKSDPRSLDNPGALLPEEFRTFVRQVRDVEAALAEPPVALQEASRSRARAWAGQAIVAARTIQAGDIVAREMLAFKRPARGGLGPELVGSVVGRKAARTLQADEQITFDDLASID